MTNSTFLFIVTKKKLLLVVAVVVLACCSSVPVAQAWVSSVVSSPSTTSSFVQQSARRSSTTTKTTTSLASSTQQDAQQQQQSGGGENSSSSSSSMKGGSLHGQNSCFLPLKQLDQDYLAPRIVQIAGAYPGLKTTEFYAVQSEESPDPGQWTYDFSDPDGPQLGTVAIEGSGPVANCADPVVIIAEHTALGVPMPDAITEPVDLIVLVDRAQTTYAERKFLVLTVPEMGDELLIGAYPTKADLPPAAEIRGHVVYTQIPWLPSMKPTKSGFMEIDEYF